jgi:predicted nucleic acid-binding protein
MVNLKGHKVYLDTNTLIYTLEGVEPDLQTGLLLPLDMGDFTAVTSEIALLETIVGPRKRGDYDLEQDFRAFLTPSEKLSVESITTAVLEQAIDLRAQYPGLKTPDEIHLATGILARCDLFVTGDQAWAKTGVTVVDPADVA